MSMKMRRMIQVLAVAAGALALMLICKLPAQASEKGDFREEVKAYADIYRVSEDELLAEGISISGLEVGGMTLMEAVDAILERQEMMHSAQIVLVLDDKSVTYSMADFGLNFDVSAEAMVKAACLGKSGSLIERYKVMADLENGGYDVLFGQEAQEIIVVDRIKAFAKQVNVDAVEATISREGGKFVITKEEAGIAVDEEDLLVQIKEIVKNWSGEHEITLTAKGVVVEPKYTEEMLSTIQDCLGQYVTDCGDLDTNRGQNILVAAGKLDGLIILPGESVSVVDILTPFTVENGYVPGNQYNEGRYELSIGGGVCLVSSTLYNVLLNAELQVDKRWNHSMIVGYMPYGFDSTVNDDGTRDLVFTNDTDYPIYIEAYAEKTPVMGHWLHMEMYGTETRDTSRREVKYYNNILIEEWPEREEFEFRVNMKLEPGEEKYIQDNYPYVVVEAYKEVWIDGEMVSKELMHTDTYRRSPAIVEHNPTEPETEETELETGEIGSDESEGMSTEEPTESGTESDYSFGSGLTENE